MQYYSQQRLPTHVYTQPETYSLSRLPVDQASTLIPDAYTAADFFALEQEKIFARLGLQLVVYNKFKILETFWFRKLLADLF